MAFVGCKKEQLEPQITPADKQAGFNPKYEQIEPLILAFKQTVELDLQGNLKTSSTTDKTVAEAEWTLEGALNFDNSHPVQMYSELEADTLIITCSNNGTNSNGETMVDGGDLAQAYANLLVSINNLVPTNEDVEVIDVEAVNETQYTTTFKVTVSGGQPLTLQPDYVKPDDNWKAGRGYGKCDGTQTGLDATDRIDQILNFNILNNFTMNLANPQQVLYYTSVNFESFNGLWYQGAPVDISEWLGQPNDPFYPSGPNGPIPFSTCLTVNQMQHYVNAVWTTISTLRPLNKDIINVNVGYDPWSGLPAGVHSLHGATYGIPVL